MRITKIIDNRREPKRPLAKSLQEIYVREDDPGSREYAELQMLYNPERRETYSGHPNNFDHEN